MPEINEGREREKDFFLQSLEVARQIERKKDTRLIQTERDRLRETD